jgi:hypothetical protein
LLANFPREKPSRYLGTELNATHKNPADIDLRVALVFPDLYDLGLGNLGILILYAILNDLPWCWCERAYAPAPDMEAKLRERGPCRCSRTNRKTRWREMDADGFTLQSELTYTNILNMIDLAGLPLRGGSRRRRAALLGGRAFGVQSGTAGAVYRLLRDRRGRRRIVEIAEMLRPMKARAAPGETGGDGADRGRLRARTVSVRDVAGRPDSAAEDAPKIVKRVVDLDGARFPTNYIVPFTQQVHDRIGLEVLRGCTQGCRFCQAGMVTRPVRERSIENVDELMERTLENTGYEEVSLVSLSTCDFLAPADAGRAGGAGRRGNRVSVSLPSLRLDSFSVELADMVAGVRRSGLTFAPEAATPAPARGD